LLARPNAALVEQVIGAAVALPRGMRMSYRERR